MYRETWLAGAAMAAALATGLSACGAAGTHDDALEPPGAAPSAVVELPLWARSVNPADGAEYRLVGAALHVIGQSADGLGADQVGVAALAEDGLFSHDLSLTTRSVTLTGPWRLERRAPGAAEFSAIDARLASPATVALAGLRAGDVAELGFRFETPRGAVIFGRLAD